MAPPQRSGWPMSSEDKPSRRNPIGRTKKSGEKTARRTSAPSKPSSASTSGATRLLADFSEVMRELGLRWYVFGAQAAIVHGRPRMTADVDITVDPGQTSTPALLEELSRAGFSLRMAFSEDFLRDARLLLLVHDATTMPLDLMLASTRMHAEFLERSRLADVGGFEVPVMSPEDVIVTKVLAGRAKDLEDVRGVLIEQRDIDLSRVRELLSELESALEDPRLVRRFERLVRDARPRR